METPRRTGTSIGYRMDHCIAFGHQTGHDVFRSRDAGTILRAVFEVGNAVAFFHELLWTCQKDIGMALAINQSYCCRRETPDGVPVET